MWSSPPRAMGTPPARRRRPNQCCRAQSCFHHYSPEAAPPAPRTPAPRAQWWRPTNRCTCPANDSGALPPASGPIAPSAAAPNHCRRLAQETRANRTRGSSSRLPQTTRAARRALQTTAKGGAASPPQRKTRPAVTPGREPLATRRMARRKPQPAAAAASSKTHPRPRRRGLQRRGLHRRCRRGLLRRRRRGLLRRRPRPSCLPGALGRPQIPQRLASVATCSGRRNRRNRCGSVGWVRRQGSLRACRRISCLAERQKQHPQRQNGNGAGPP
mmetsp:Transcript_1951/g.6228  ORF Transcript_1951/g.6228 Transcript_1951/m.6228 type:complete len:272 (+) Transcript_1951:101-916(+)